MRGCDPQIKERLRMLKADFQLSTSVVRGWHDGTFPYNRAMRMGRTAATHTPPLLKFSTTLQAGATRRESPKILIPDYFCRFPDGNGSSSKGVFSGEYSIKVENHRLVAWGCPECGAANSDLTPDFCPLCPFKK